jgi:hypothetical protein
VALRGSHPARDLGDDQQRFVQDLLAAQADDREVVRPVGGVFATVAFVGTGGGVKAVAVGLDASSLW